MASCGGCVRVRDRTATHLWSQPLWLSRFEAHLFSLKSLATPPGYAHLSLVGYTPFWRIGPLKTPNR